MISIRFPDPELERKALGFLVGRFAFKNYADGHTLVPETALSHLAREGISFTVEGPVPDQQDTLAGPTDSLLERMSLARRVVLWAGVVSIGLIAAILLQEKARLLTYRGELLLANALFCALFGIVASSLATWYYVFRVGFREKGAGYAVGHLVLCIVLTPMLLIGTMLVPLMVRCDIERLKRTEGEPFPGWQA